MRPPFPLLPGVDAPELPATEIGPYRAPRADTVPVKDLPAFARDWAAELRAQMLANPFDGMAFSAQSEAFCDFDIVAALERAQAMMEESICLSPAERWYSAELLAMHRAPQFAYLPLRGI